MEMTEQELKICWDLAQKEFLDKPKNPRESNQVYMARCWMKAFESLVNKKGLKICLKDSVRS